MWRGHFSCLVIKGAFEAWIWAWKETVERDKQAKSLIMRKIFWEITCQTRHLLHFKCLLSVWTFISIIFHVTPPSKLALAEGNGNWIFIQQTVSTVNVFVCANYPLARDLCLALNLWIVLTILALSLSLSQRNFPITSEMKMGIGIKPLAFSAIHNIIINFVSNLVIPLYFSLSCSRRRFLLWVMCEWGVAQVEAQFR